MTQSFLIMSYVWTRGFSLVEPSTHHSFIIRFAGLIMSYISLVRITSWRAHKTRLFGFALQGRPQRRTVGQRRKSLADLWKLDPIFVTSVCILVAFLFS